jgi:hypothetical protein
MPHIQLMPEQSLDSRGRVTIEPTLRPFLGKRFVQVLTPRGIVLRPLTGKIDWKDAPADLAINARRIAREELDKEIEEELDTIHGVSLDGKRRRKPAGRIRKAK